MGRQPVRRRLQGRFREAQRLAKPWLRSARGSVATLLHRIRRLIGAPVATRVVSTLRAARSRPVGDPAIGVVGEAGAAGRQTEPSISADDASARFLAHGHGLEDLPATHLEAMLLAAAAEDLDWVAAGWAAPAPGRYGPSGLAGREPDVPRAAHLLLRRPANDRRARSAVVGRVVPHITSPDRCSDLVSIDDHPPAGPYRLRFDAAGRTVVRHRCIPVDQALAGLAAVDGPRTVLFLLPFLAVGGAERLLFDLIEGLRRDSRPLIATTEPHLESLGQTVDRARTLTPHVYTLGDWLPRPALPSALRHLIRRWRVSSLVCWNGSTLFYDEAVKLRQAFPELRIVNQHFNHAGGWIEHLSPSLIRAVDVQIAVNTPTARALAETYAVPADRIATIHHAVAPQPPPDPDRRAAIRRELGVDDDTVVIGSFIRMHPQKRPLDIVAVARRMSADPVHFLLVGGGPLDDAVTAEIARNPPPNLTRRPLVEDATPLYDAVDLCLMSSEFEGLPIFLLDGLARGLPCVAPPVGDIPLLLDHGGGRMSARPGDLDGLVAGIRELLPKRARADEGSRGRRTVETRFGLDRYVQAYESVIFPSQ